MARGIYEIKLKERFFPALSPEEALEEHNIHAGFDGELTMAETDIQLVVKEEHTMQLFLLAKTMCDMDRFALEHIETVVGALAIQLGYFSTYKEVANCIMTWIERLDDMTIIDVEEWIIG